VGKRKLLGFDTFFPSLQWRAMGEAGPKALIKAGVEKIRVSYLSQCLAQQQIACLAYVRPWVPSQHLNKQATNK
jgi:hypothetical protein